MKSILILLMIYLNLFQTDSKPYRVLLEDRVLPYYDSSVGSIADFVSIDNLILEQIDDDNVQIGGHIEFIKSMDRNLPLVMNARTQNYQQATWNHAAYRMTLPNTCIELTNPQRFWYNVTKLWTSEVCPAQKGDIWKIESQSVNIIYDVPPTFPIVPWRAYLALSQGLPGLETVKFGYGIEFNFLPIN